MIINNSNIVSVKKEMEMPAQKAQTQCSTDKNIPEQNTVDVSADTLRAYTGIENKNKKVSPKEVVEFLKNTGMKNENLYPEILKSLEDENGEIAQLSFDFLKSFQAKNNPIIISSKIFNAAKENEKINYAALKLIDSIMEPRDVGAFYLKDYFCEVLNGIKNKDGSFNKDALKFFIKHSDVYNKLFNFKPQSAFAPLKNNNGDFDLKALDYADKKLTEKEKLQKLIPQLYSARDKDGNFSYEIMELNDYLSQIFKEWQINYVQEIALSFPKDKKKERDTFIELAKSMKDEQDFSQIFNFIKNMKAGENANSALEFNKASVDFLLFL